MIAAVELSVHSQIISAVWVSASLQEKTTHIKVIFVNSNLRKCYRGQTRSFMVGKYIREAGTCHQGHSQKARPDQLKRVS